ncbi:MAG: HAD family hydrolase [Bacilli bacterium]|nr:HAD family hydrolase [Bacilli bacterium]
MMKKKLIFFDLDDTLLKKDKSVSNNTLKVLELLKKQGNKIIIATARNKISTMPLVDLLKPDYTIINAGAYIIDNNKNVIRSLLISKETSLKIINEIFKEIKTLSIQTDDILYTNEMYDKGPVRTYYDFKDFKGIDCYKILVKDLKLEKGKELGIKHNLDFENYFGGRWSRFSHIESTKAKALEFITEYEKMSLDDTIAFGDDYGDIAMLQASGIGVAVGNALEDVKKEAKYICDNADDDGVARFLDNYFNLGVYSGGN